jgi:RNA polymerase sigma factor (sigma-70 family)
MATNAAHAQRADRARDDPVVTELVTRARNGDRHAWDALVDRYAPLIWSICRRYRLEGADAQDAAQTVWLQLVDHLGRLRDPAALPGWLATTTRHECGRIARAARRPGDAGSTLAVAAIPDEHAPAADQDLLAAERHAALRQALKHLSPGCQQLLALLIEDPPLSYAQISARLGIPVGSIGPRRRRCLDQLRRHPAITALINVGTLDRHDSWISWRAGTPDHPPPRTTSPNTPARTQQPLSTPPHRVTPAGTDTTTDPDLPAAGTQNTRFWTRSSMSRPAPRVGAESAI